MGWFKSLFRSKSRRSVSGLLSVEHLEVRLTPDAKTVPAFHDFAIGISENNCAANSITLIDDILLQQNSTDYRSSQVYFCSNDASAFSSSAFQSVNKLDDVALQAASTKGVVLIDSSLVATIPVDELKGSLVVSIDGNRDVVSQITTALEGLANVPVLRIISHGNDGVLYFANQAFDSTVLAASATQVASWGKSLTPDADILLYGCSIANTDAGKAFVEQFASITQADIGASSNLTGKGGDEVLEFQVGQVSNTLIASTIDYNSANLTLAQITVTTTLDTGPGSLRQAITDANSTSANDEIIFASSLFTNGASTITLGSALPDIETTATAGTLTITGLAASSIIISGNNGDVNRDFNIFNIATCGDLSILGVTVSGAKTTSFGGAFNNSGILNIANSTLSNNSATFGGAIENNYGAILTITNSTIFNNSASYGGGIDNYGGTLTVINSTLSSNTVTYSGNGGGIYSSSSSTITNTIIANSTGGDFAGTTPTTSTNNFITSGTLSGATTVTSQQLNLGPLQNNGGPTFTIALGAGSVAIGAGNATISNAAPINGLDQRGVTRSSTAPSVGAYEGIATAPTVTLNTANLASNAATLTIAGTGFNTIAAYNSVTLSSGTGTVTSATATQLSITFTTLPSAVGSLTAIITSFGSTSGNPVQVGTIVAAPSGTSFGTAIALTAAMGGFSADGIISVAGEEDYYSFTAAATGVVEFTMSAINNSAINNPDVDSILTIYDSNLVQLARNDDSNSTTLNSFISLNVTAGSVYFLKATAFVSSTGDYRVSATPIAPAGASFGTAIALTAQQGSTVASFDGDINPAYNADYYIYTAAATGVVNFAMAAINNSGVDSILTIYDSNFVQIARNDDSNGGFNSFISLNVDVNAIYYIRATAFESDTGAYQISATVISAPINAPVATGDSFATAITLTASSGNVASAIGEINPAYDPDYYTYSATTTGVVNFAMNAINNSGVDSILTIYNSTFVQIARNDDSNGGFNSFISLNVTAGSVYYIKATAYGSGMSATGEYRVSATFIAPTYGQAGAPGDSFATAIALTASQGSTVQSAVGDINPAYNADYYKYIANTTGVVNFAMDAINNSGIDSYLAIYNSNLVEIARNDDSNGSLNSFISLNVTANTIYYLKATAYGLGTGAYQVSAAFTAPSTVQGTTFATAITLTAGNPIEGVISTALEADYYKYTAAATGGVNFEMTAISNSGVDTFLTIYNSEFIEIARNDDSNGTRNSFISLNVTANAIYYFKATAFGSGTGTYQVSATFIAPTTVTTGTPGDSFTNAITLTSNSTSTVASYDGEINPGSNADYYKYTATTTGVINFAMVAVNNSGVDSILTIYDSNFLQIARNDDSNGTRNSFISLNVNANAIYYLKATAYGSGTGAYRVSASSNSVFNSTPPGATFGTAINLTAGDPIEGVISTGLEADYYKYIATTTGSVNFAMNAISNSGVDTYLTIYNSNFIEIAYDDDSGSGSNSLVSISVNANAIYYIKATAYGSGTGAYRISANNLDNQNTAPGASFATAINLTRAAPITGAISTALEADYYKYLAAATGGVTFEMTAINNSGVDTYLTIYNSDFIEIAQDDDSGTGLNSLISISVSANAIYYLKATAYGSGTGDYQVSATVQTNDDVGGSLDATATLLSFTGNVASQNKTIGAALDVDVFRLTADSEGIFEIAVTPTNGSTLDPVIEVIGNDGTTLLEFSSANAGVSAFALPFLTLGQQVYVRVSGAGSTGNYTLQATKPAAIVDFYANNYNIATSSLPVGIISFSSGANSGSLTNANMVIESATDVDVFSFTTNRSGPIQVSVSKAVGSNLDTIVSILDASGNVFEFNDDSNGTTNSTVVFQGDNNTLYYIRVSGYGGTTGQFDISVTDLTPTVAETDGTGTDLTHATDLTFVANSASFQGNISSAGDQDFFSITASSSGVLTISLAAGTSSGLDTYLYLYNSDKVLILEDDDSSSGLNSSISINVLTGQTYYLQASGFGSSMGAYTISASISAADDHANQAGESATRLVVSSTNAVNPTAGTINPSTDNDVFLYKATADGSITINVTPTNNSALNSYLFVYDSTGNILLDYNDGNSSTDSASIINLQIVRDEVYFFMVSGAEGTTGAYNISVTSVTDIVGNTIELATNLPISTTSTANTTVGTVNGSIGSNGDVDFYKVAIGADGRYAFRASANPTSNGLDTTIAVYSEDGQLMGENDDASASSLNSSLSLNLTVGEIVYVRVAGYGESTGDYISDVVYLSAAIADDFGNTIDDAYSFVLDNAHSYTTSSANIQFAGDADVFHGVADLTGNITLVLTPSANLQGNIRAFVTRNGENIQVGSVYGSAVGGVVNLTFPVSASENFYIEISGNNGTTGAYNLSVNNVIATNTVRPTDDSVIDRIAEELREEFTRIIAAASANADINATSQVIMTQLLAVIQRLIPGFSGLVGFFDPVDLNLTGGGGTVGSQGNNSTNSNPSASLSSRGALDLVVIPGAASGQYNLNMTGTGGGQVLAGVAMVGANGQVINPTITGGQSSGGIAASSVPKTGLNIVLDFGSNSGGGNGNGGGGNSSGGNGGGDTAQSGSVLGSTTASASASTTSSSSTASAATGLTGLAALANAITQSATASGADSATSAANLANLASIALGLGSTAATLDEKQLAKDLGGDAPAGDLDLSGSDNLKTSGSFVLVTFAEAYNGFNQAVFSTLDAENQVVSEIANIFDKVLPSLVPSEFENSVENLLVQTKKSLLEDGKATLLKTGDILADIIMSKLVKNLPAAQPAKNKVDSKVPSFEFVIANLVEQNKNESATEENCFGEHTAITNKIPHCFEEIFNSVNRNILDDCLSGPSILRNDQQNKTAEALGVIAGVLLAPGVLSSTHGTRQPAFEKPKPKKQKS